MRSFDEKSALFRPLLPPTTGHDVRRGPLSTAFCHGHGSLGGAAGRGESRPLKPQFQPSRNAPHYLLHATNGLSRASFSDNLQYRLRRYEAPARGCSLLDRTWRAWPYGCG